MLLLDIRNWYWLADDGRIFASASESRITASDPAYLAWLAIGYTPTAWPRDGSGNQTDAALQEVLAPHGMYANLNYYSANARYNHASGGVVVTSISPVVFLSDPVSRNTVDSANTYAVNNPGHITDWKLSDGSFIQLTAAQLAHLLQEMATFVQACFTCESETAASIGSGSITTRSQVDAAFAAISNVMP